jgi:hypothetical protein
MMTQRASTPGTTDRPSDVDVEGTEEFGPHDHVSQFGQCAICGAWVPSARCLSIGCGWSAQPDPVTLQSAVAHRVRCGHTVRVQVG